MYIFRQYVHKSKFKIHFYIFIECIILLKRYTLLGK